MNGVVFVELEPESHFSISILAGWGEFSFSVMLFAAAALVLLIAGLFSVGELFKLVLVLYDRRRLGVPEFILSWIKEKK